MTIGLLNISKLVLKYSGKFLIFYSSFHVIKTYIIPVDFVLCNGSSMEPLINHNDILLCEKVSTNRKTIYE
jgi:signal peptidase I